jgi:hypothetical protein
MFGDRVDFGSQTMGLQLVLYNGQTLCSKYSTIRYLMPLLVLWQLRVLMDQCWATWRHPLKSTWKDRFMWMEFHSGRSLSESESEGGRMRWATEKVELILYLQLTCFFFQNLCKLICSTCLLWIARLGAVAAAAFLDLIIVKTMDKSIFVTDCGYRALLSSVLMNYWL